MLENSLCFLKVRKVRSKGDSKSTSIHSTFNKANSGVKRRLPEDNTVLTEPGFIPTVSPGRAEQQQKNNNQPNSQTPTSVNVTGL